MNVLLVPGFMLDSDLWQAMRGRLEAYGKLIDVDTASDTSIEAMADRAAASLTNKAVIIGFSMGGFITRAIAYRAPHLVVGLGLIATSLRGDDQQQTIARQETLEASTHFRRLSRRVVEASLHPDKRIAKTVERIQAKSERLGPEVYRRQCQIARHSDADRLGELTCPTIVISSTQDSLRTLAESEELAGHITIAKLIVLHGSGLSFLSKTQMLSWMRWCPCSIRRRSYRRDRRRGAARIVVKR